MNISCAAVQFSLVSYVFLPSGEQEKLHSLVIHLKLVKKAIFDFLSFGISSLPPVLSDIKVNLQVMVSRLANLSKPERFDSFDTDLCVCLCLCVCVCIPRAQPVSHYRNDTVKGPLLFKQVACYNAGSAGSALRHVVTDSFSAVGQNKHRLHIEC